MNRLLKVVLAVCISMQAGAWASAGSEGLNPTGSTYYVATNGNDSYPGSLQYPWRTMDKAADSIHAGDTVYLRGGTYHENADFYTDGTASAPITIAGYPGEIAILDGNSYTIPPKKSGKALLQVYGDWYTIRDLTFTGSGEPGLTTRGAHDTVDHVFSHHNWNWGILMTGDYDITQNSEIWSNSMVNENLMNDTNEAGGVTCARYPDHCAIRFNQIWENWGEGISTFESLHTLIEANTCYDNENNIYISDTRYATVARNFIYCSAGNRIDPLGQQVGILVGDELGVPLPLGPGGARNDSSNNTFLNNIILGCDNNLFATQIQAANNLYAYNTFVNSDGTQPGYTADVQFHRGTAPNQRFVNNLVFQEGTTAIVQMDEPGVVTFSHNLWSRTPPSSFHVVSPSDVIGDPAFARTGSPYSPGWYGLTSLSPAIDKGMPIVETGLDYYGHVRGISSDIGAIEYAILVLEPSIFLPLILR